MLKKAKSLLLARSGVFDHVRLTAGNAFLFDVRYVCCVCRNLTLLVSIGARIPVLSFTHVATGVRCDLVLNNTAALANSALLRFFASYTPANTPPNQQTGESKVKTLIKLVRRWAHGRRLDIKGRNGVLSPYAWTILVCHFAQQVGLLPGPHNFLEGMPSGSSTQAPESLRIAPSHVDILSKDPSYFMNQIANHVQSLNSRHSASQLVAGNKRKARAATPIGMNNLGPLDLLMNFFKYVLGQFNIREDVASLRFAPRDMDGRRRCCHGDESSWVRHRVPDLLFRRRFLLCIQS